MNQDIKIEINQMIGIRFRQGREIPALCGMIMKAEIIDEAGVHQFIKHKRKNYHCVVEWSAIETVFT